MQDHEMRHSGVCSLNGKSESKREKEAIHSGHFMVSHFEAEAQDDEYDVAVPVPETKYLDSDIRSTDLQLFGVNKPCITAPPGQLAIETSLSKLFQCMSLAYRQKLTSPKWNRFKGIRLRWKDKIRLNNVIWRCWHMQFIKKQNTLVCQFASPLDEGTHNKPEAVVLEGKYWKRKLAAVTAEYKKWRMFYRNRIIGWANKDWLTVPDVDIFEWRSQYKDMTQSGSMMVDEDYMELMSDTLFSTITSNQPFAFPDTREIARGANLADFIQPSLVQLQPTLDDFMDTLEPFQEFFSPKLPPVPEECAVSDITFRTGQTFTELELETRTPAVLNSQQAEPSDFTLASQTTSLYQPVVSCSESLPLNPVSSDEVKMTRLYNSKSQTAQGAFKPLAPSVKPLLQDYMNESTVTEKTGCETRFSNISFIYGSSNSGVPGSRKVNTEYLTPTETSYRQQAFKSHIDSKLKSQQHFKKSAEFLTSGGNNIESNDVRALAQPSDSKLLQNINTQTTKSPVGTIVISKSASLPAINKEDALFVPKQNLPSLKGRHRTRSGSSLLAAKTRTPPPPLSSASSDSALNIPGVLLAHLLSGNSGIYSYTNDRFSATHSVNKNTGPPFLGMPPKTTVQNKILPRPAQNSLFTSSGTTSSQNYTGFGSLSSHDTLKCNQFVSNIHSSSSPSETSASPVTCPSSTSPKTNRGDSANTGTGLHEHRRVCHINAEQKRRYNIKYGFEVLHSLIPHVNQNTNGKLSKAVMLQKGAQYIRQLQDERLKAKEDMENLKYQIENLNVSISNCQSLLPATGAPVSRHRTTKMREMFDEFIRVRTMENWKFWIFSVLFEPLLQSFSCSVSTASYDDLFRSTLIWVEQHCSLVDLRPAVINSLRNISRSTEILSDPSKLPEEARAAVNRKKP